MTSGGTSVPFAVGSGWKNAMPQITRITVRIVAPDCTKKTITEAAERRKRPMDIKRGDIYYIGGGYATGSEQRSGRPAVVISNDKNNKHSSTVEVVYLTTQPKRNLPTHVTIHSLSKESIAICEQITTVAIERFGEYRGHITPDEMEGLEDAILISLGIHPKVVEVPTGRAVPVVSAAPDQDMAARLAEAETRCNVLQQMYDALLGRVVGAK